MQRPLMERDPCPDRILDDVGMAFGMGAVGGSVYHFLNGLRNSPKGARIAGGMEAAHMNMPRIAGGFAVWGGLFSACNCALVYVRKKEDPYNPIIAGAATGGILAIRQGARAVVRSSLQGAVLLALVEGAGTMMMNSIVPSVPVDDPFVYHVEAPAHVEKSSVGGWFGGLFQKKVEGGATNSSHKTETLETLDAPSIPIPSFDYK